MPRKPNAAKSHILIYVLGPDRKDDGGMFDRKNPQNAGTDLGFQFWNPDKRRQAPSK